MLPFLFLSLKKYKKYKNLTRKLPSTHVFILKCIKPILNQIQITY